MANLTTVANAAFDSLAAAVPAPFGPLTRTGDLNEDPRVLPNSHQRIGVTGQGSVAFTISYDELSKPDVRDDVIREAYGISAKIFDLKNFAEMLYRQAEEIDLLTGTAEEYKDVMRLFQYYKDIIGITPALDWSIISKNNIPDASFTYSGSGASRTFVNTSVGYGLNFWFWDFGDGTYSFLETPPAKTWAVDDDYTVRLIVGGIAGFDSYEETITIDVP